MIEIYCDESETQSPGLFTLAGWIASPSAWRAVSEAWQSMLNETGPYPVTAFHMVDIAAEPGGGEFAGWSRDERDRLIVNATDILLNSNLAAHLYGIGVTIVIDDFVMAAKEKQLPEWIADVRALYVWCYESVFVQALRRPMVQNGISFVFDRKKGAEHHVLEHFARAKASLRDENAGLLHECVFKDDDEVIPIQAADFLAYELRRAVYQRLTAPQRKPRRSFERLCTREHSFRCFDSRFLTDAWRAFEIDPNRSPYDVRFNIPVSEF